MDLLIVFTVFTLRFLGTMVLWGLISLPVGWIYLAWKNKTRNLREAVDVIRENIFTGNRDADGNTALTISTMIIVFVSLALFSWFADSDASYFEGLSIEIVGTFIGFYFAIVLEEIIRGKARSDSEVPVTMAGEALPFDELLLTKEDGGLSGNPPNSSRRHIQLIKQSRVNFAGRLP